MANMFLHKLIWTSCGIMAMLSKLSFRSFWLLRYTLSSASSPRSDCMQQSNPQNPTPPRHAHTHHNQPFANRVRHRWNTRLARQPLWPAIALGLLTPLRARSRQPLQESEAAGMRMLEQRESQLKPPTPVAGGRRDQGRRAPAQHVRAHSCSSHPRGLLCRDAATHQEEEGAKELDIARQDQIVGVSEGHAPDGALEAHRGAIAAIHAARRPERLPPACRVPEALRPSLLLN